MQIVADTTNTYLIEVTMEYDPKDESSRVYKLLKVVAWVVCDDGQMHGLTMDDLEDGLWNESRMDGEIWTSSMYELFVGYQVGDGEPSPHHRVKAFFMWQSTIARESIAKQ